MNHNIISQIEKLVIQTNNKIENFKANNELAQAKSFQFKLNSFRKALKNIKLIDFEITDSSQVKDIKGIGKGILGRIDEILETGTLKELDNLNNISEYKDIEDLQKITGIGPSKAKSLFKDKIKLQTLLDKIELILSGDYLDDQYYLN